MTSSAGGDRPAPGSEVSDRWADWRREVDLEEYAGRWQRLAASGQTVHGEADLVESLGQEPVLDAGCGTGRVAIELARRGIDVAGVDLDSDMLGVARRTAPDLLWLEADLATMRLDRRFAVIVMAGNVLPFARPADHDRIVQTLAQHLEPAGLLVAGFSLEPHGITLDAYDAMCARSGLELRDRWATWDRQPLTEPATYHVSVHARSGER